jgi:TonB family protein
MALLASLLLGMAAPETVVAPAMLLPGFSLGAEDYPLDAILGEQGGTVRYAVEIDASGKPTACSIIKPAGIPGFDRIVCAKVMQQARFAPALDIEGKPVASSAEYAATSRITRGYRTRFPDQTGHAVMVTFDPAGEVKSCTVQPMGNSKAVTAEQQALCGKLGDRLHFRALLGQPTQGLASAALRFMKLDGLFEPVLHKQSQPRRLLARVDFDVRDSGRITWCRVTTPPVSPLLGLQAETMCGPGQFGPTAPPSGGFARVFIIDAVATPKSGPDKQP